jgi:hypothetical protein
LQGQSSSSTHGNADLFCEDVSLNARLLDVMKMEQGTVVREDVSADHDLVAETHEIL